MSRYDSWLLPRERSGVFDVTCKATPATCANCGHVTPEPKKVTLYRPRIVAPLPEDDRPPMHLRALKGVLPYIAGTCPRCGSEEYGPDECPGRWQSRGDWQEGAGVELLEDECPECGVRDNLEAEWAEE